MAKNILERALEAINTNGDLKVLTENEHGTTPLHLAMSRATLQVNALLNAGASSQSLEQMLKAQDNEGNTPIVLSILLNKDDKTEAICTRLFDSQIQLDTILNIQNNAKTTAIQLMTGNSKSELFAKIATAAKKATEFDKLLNVADDTKKTVLHWAAIDEANEIAENILGEIANGAASGHHLLAKDISGMTALHWTIERKNVDQVGKFKEAAKNNPDATLLGNMFLTQDNNGNTILSSALIKGEQEVAKSLLEGLFSIKDKNIIINILQLKNTGETTILDLLVDDNNAKALNYMLDQAAQAGITIEEIAKDSPENFELIKQYQEKNPGLADSFKALVSYVVSNLPGSFTAPDVKPKTTSETMKEASMNIATSVFTKDQYQKLHATASTPVINVGDAIVPVPSSFIQLATSASTSGSTPASTPAAALSASASASGSTSAPSASSDSSLSSSTPATPAAALSASASSADDTPKLSGTSASTQSSADEHKAAIGAATSDTNGRDETSAEAATKDKLKKTEGAYNKKALAFFSAGVTLYTAPKLAADISFFTEKFGGYDEIPYTNSKISNIPSVVTMLGGALMSVSASNPMPLIHAIIETQTAQGVVANILTKQAVVDTALAVDVALVTSTTLMTWVLAGIPVAIASCTLSAIGVGIDMAIKDGRIDADSANIVKPIIAASSEAFSVFFNPYYVVKAASAVHLLRQAKESDLLHKLLKGGEFVSSWAGESYNQYVVPMALYMKDEVYPGALKKASEFEFASSAKAVMTYVDKAEVPQSSSVSDEWLDMALGGIASKKASVAREIEGLIEIGASAGAKKSAGNYNKVFVAHELPEFVKSINYFVERVGYNTTPLQNKANIWAKQYTHTDHTLDYAGKILELGSGMAMSFSAKSLVPFLNGVVGTATVQSMVKDHLGNDGLHAAKAMFSVGTTLVVAYGGYITWPIVIAGVAIQLADEGLGYAIDNKYVSNNKLANVAKPALEVVSDIFSLSYSPNVALKFMQVPHLLKDSLMLQRSILDNYDEKQDVQGYIYDKVDPLVKLLVELYHSHVDSAHA